MELWSCLIIISSLTAVTRAEIDVDSINSYQYYGYTPDSENSLSAFAINAFPFMFMHHGLEKFIINGNETDGKKELGEDEATFVREIIRRFQLRLQRLTKELVKQTGTKIVHKKPVVHIYTEENYTPGPPNTLYCYAEKFYPYEIEVTFLVNGNPFTEPSESSETMVAADWTFHVLKYIRINPQEGDTYSCQVDHVSLDKPMVVLMDQPPPQPHIGTIVCAVGVIVGALGLMVGLYLVTKLCSRQGKPCSSQFCK
ncbi:RLA class II histocompatibility antigen, DP alpha-1 chain-like [Scyliorhinus canicula]|uniref:RLA class II histocompatibility antigen, DP alpha-1 chain-like n=1 Tax=Scyliorhinus canicula TaxID=7830 RepID=UPI0018F72B7C|nr:RLA class II histocompatibility antigen, DP alpha-1 chain-like [Scyliorhinus canicula]